MHTGHDVVVQIAQVFQLVLGLDLSLELLVECLVIEHGCLQRIDHAFVRVLNVRMRAGDVMM